MFRNGVVYCISVLKLISDKAYCSMKGTLLMPKALTAERIKPKPKLQRPLSISSKRQKLLQQTERKRSIEHYMQTYCTDFGTDVLKQLKL